MGASPFVRSNEGLGDRSRLWPDAAGLKTPSTLDAYGSKNAEACVKHPLDTKQVVARIGQIHHRVDRRRAEEWQSCRKPQNEGGNILERANRPNRARNQAKETSKRKECEPLEGCALLEALKDGEYYVSPRAKRAAPTEDKHASKCCDHKR